MHGLGGKSTCLRAWGRAHFRVIRIGDNDTQGISGAGVEASCGCRGRFLAIHLHSFGHSIALYLFERVTDSRSATLERQDRVTADLSRKGGKLVKIGLCQRNPGDTENRPELPRVGGGR